MIGLLLGMAAATAEPPGMLPALLARIRLGVPDAREISDLQVCPPKLVSRDGRKFSIELALNRPRAGRRYLMADWKDGAFVRIADDGLNTDNPVGLDGIIARAVERKFEAKCRWVGAAELKAAWEQVP